MARPLRFWFPLPPDYGWSGVRGDVLAGLTLGVVLIPQAMAYGLLAGVPAVYGLYAALVPLLVYTLLASTPHVSVGPTALASLLCLSGIGHLAEPGSPEYIAYAVVLAGLTGLIQLAFGVLRMGGMVSLLSRPVLSGFVSAASVLIVTSQLKPILGLDMPRTAYLYETLVEFGRHVGSVHGPTAALGLSTLAILILGKRFLPRAPVMLIWIVLATVLVYLLRLDRMGIDVVGDIPEGLPAFNLPILDAEAGWQLLPVALVLALISFVETLSIGNSFATHHGYYRIQPNRELIALGLSKIAGSFFAAIPTSASFSRSAVVEEGGGRGPLSGAIAFLLLGAVLLFFTPLFYYLPLTMLAAVIIFSVGKLFDLVEMRRLWKLAPREFAVLFVTFLFTLFAGLQYGIAGGVALSLFFMFLRAARPHLAELGRIPGTNAFRNIARFADAEVDPDLLIVRFDAELYFGNAEFFGDRILAMAEEKGPQLRVVILDAHTINDLDTTGLHALEQLHDKLGSRRIELYLSGVIGPVRDILYRSGLMERMGVGSHFLSIQDAIRHFREEGGGRHWDLPAVQHD
ncbi:SulP family inorganic anion transporter [Lewinella sp. JB7]|uniref:SulP family inorganic anion transporter n=1 Tax=Lewinella sp. JB7 TaxID=2962887 RepID=UPI0020C97695|nr:sulfate permease [Lewinella sp. JB7]MCP9237021.1 sulfate permease [Lewinella sp. JB7]